MPEDGSRDRASEQPGERRSRARSWTMLIGLAAAVVLAAGVAYLALGAASPAGPGTGASGDEGPQRAETGSTSELGPPTLGDEDAPVTMVEYSDFQCPYCGQFAREVEPELIEQYVESGTLKIEWRDFPYLGQESVNAALAAREAQQQGRFWEYHEALYENQDSVNGGAFSDDNLKSLAQEAGVDPGKLEQSLASGEHEETVARDFEKGQQVGVTGTPTFIINDEIIVGAQPKKVFEQAIEKAAAEAGGAGD